MSPTKSEDHAWWRRWTLIVAGCLALMFATRWPLAPTRHLYHIDNVNFALALDNFNPALHQPQPPGDPMYVALTRWMRPFVPSAEILFPLSGVLGSAAAMAALWRVGEMLLGARAGAVAALLLALNPIFWLAGVGNYVRVYLALGAATVAGLAWKSLDGSVWYWSAAAAALGLFAGFRPEMAFLLAPLVAAAGWKRAAPWWQWLAVGACGAATLLPWLWITAQHSGGLASLYRLNQAYLAQDSRHSSWLYGATLVEGLRMAAASLYWNLLGAAPWAALIPFAWVRLRREVATTAAGRRLALFLAVWFAPPLLFYTVVYIHNPDHALTVIPAVSLAGAWVLTRLPRSWFWWAAPATLGATVVLFFYPTGSPFWASNYRIAEYTIRTDEQVYTHLGLFEKMGPVTVLLHGAYMTAREIGYYYPQVPVVGLESGGALRQLGMQIQAAADADGEVRIAAGKLLWLDPVNQADAGIFAEMSQALGGESGSEGSVHWANVPAGSRFRVGPQWIHAEDPKGSSK